MPLKTSRAVREFQYNGLKLPDPNPTSGVEAVRDIFAMTYPEIATAQVSGPEVVGGKMIYKFERAIGSKG